MIRKLIVVLLGLAAAVLAGTIVLTVMFAAAAVIIVARFLVYGILGIFAKPVVYLKRPSICKTGRRTGHRYR